MGTGVIPVEDVARHGLPAEPDGRTHPNLHAFWCRMLGGDVRFVQPVQDLVPDVPPPVQPPSAQEQWTAGGRCLPPFGPRIAPGLRSRPVAASRVASRRVRKDSNWSGATIAPSGGERFTQVWGSWRVPEPALPGDTADLPAPAQHRCSIWVGLGAYRRHSRSLPQVGITQAVGRGKDGRLEHRTWAWHQWWVRDRKFGPIAIANFPVEPGDEVMCWLAAESPNRVAYHIRNLTSGLLTSGRAEVGDPAAPLDGTAAEWIVERPTHLETGELYPLPAFGSVDFRDCGAETRCAGLDTPGTQRDLHAATLIRMSRVLRKPSRTSVVSVSRRMGDTGVRVTHSPDLQRRG